MEKLDDQKVASGEVQMRHMFCVEDGYDYVHGDLSQVELKIMAVEAGDVELLKAAFEGDLHNETAATFLGMTTEAFLQHSYYKFNRGELGKRINFGLSFGSEGHSLVRVGKWKDENGRVRNITWKMLDEGMARWKARFYRVAEFMERVPRETRDNNGILVNAFGRERRFGDELWSPEDWKRAEAERQAVNFKIQGAASALMNRLLNRVHAVVEQYIASGQIQRGDIKLVNTVHDSGGWEVKKYLTEWFVEVLRHETAMVVPQLQNYTFSMDIGVGNCWAEAEIAA
jgi:DNA polymerase I-like protein with 3'-5' exonuclease and polymerase domains